MRDQTRTDRLAIENRTIPAGWKILSKNHHAATTYSAERYHVSMYHQARRLSVSADAPTLSAAIDTAVMHAIAVQRADCEHFDQAPIGWREVTA